MSTSTPTPCPTTGYTGAICPTNTAGSGHIPADIHTLASTGVDITFSVIAIVILVALGALFLAWDYDRRHDRSVRENIAFYLLLLWRGTAGHQRRAHARRLAAMDAESGR